MFGPRRPPGAAPPLASRVPREKHKADMHWREVMVTLVARTCRDLASMSAISCRGGCDGTAFWAALDLAAAPLSLRDSGGTGCGCDRLLDRVRADPGHGRARSGRPGATAACAVRPDA